MPAQKHPTAKNACPQAGQRRKELVNILRAGYLEVARKILEQYRENGSQLDLHANQDEIIHEILEPNIGPDNRMTRTHQAHGQRAVQALKLLFAYEPFYGRFEISGHQDFHVTAIEACNLEAFAYLLSLEKSHGKLDLHKQDGKIFAVACQYSWIEALDYLIALEPTHGQFDIHRNEEQIMTHAILMDHEKTSTISRSSPPLTESAPP
jgi:hypothetical protein